MGRPLRPRPDPEGASIYHAFNRGNNRQELFLDDDDRVAYLDALTKAKERYPFALLGYCLMPNHVHLVLRPGPDQSLSRILQSLTVAHTWRFHRRRGTTGHVWQGRFKSPAVEDGSHFLAVLAYVESNPVRAGIVADPAEFPWSSHPGRIGQRADPSLDDFPEWAELGRTEEARRTAWRRRVAKPDEEPTIAAIRASVASGRPLGDPEWVEAASARLGLPSAPTRPRGRPRKSGNPS